MNDVHQQGDLFEQLPANNSDTPEQALTVTTVSLVDHLLAENKIRVVDVKLAQLLCQQGNGEPQSTETQPLFYLILLLCIAQQSQHSCLTLSAVNWQNPFHLRANELTQQQGYQVAQISPFSHDFNSELAQEYLQSQACVGDNKPLQLFADKLYFSRLGEYEHTLAQRLLTMAERAIQIDRAQLSALLTQYFPDTAGADPAYIDWQKVACAIAASKGFSVITGGPGTGKTTTVTKLLAILQSLYQNAPLTIKLVAPTGKAAARLSESILGAVDKLPDTPAAIKALIPVTAQTIHRLLGVKPLTNKFRHNKANPLHVDVLIVDEASMVDLSLMAKLIEALPPQARLILLGDKDQLASVDTGSVMSDLCQGLTLGQMPKYSQQRCDELNALCFNQQSKLVGCANIEFKLADCIAFLQHSYRFDANSGIGQFALAVNNNDLRRLSEVEQKIHQGQFSDVILDYNFVAKPIEKLVQSAAEHYSNYLNLIHQGANVATVHNAFARYQLLAAVREGDYGVNSLNQRIERALQQQGLITFAPEQRHYLGMPIMINQNDYQLKLFNGDIGILMPDESGQLKAVFIDEQLNIRAFSPARLPSHDKVYVMTIHKSQGSEFSHTAMILPPLQHATSGVNRQLVYTGITRAKHTFELVADSKVLKLAMANSVSRSSGLYERLIEK